MDKMLEELIVKEYINIVKELKDMNVSDLFDSGLKDCFELNDFILFKNDIDWELLKVIIKEENEEGCSSKWDDLEV